MMTIERRTNISNAKRRPWTVTRIFARTHAGKKVVHGKPCQLWTGGCDSSGYPQIRTGSRLDGTQSTIHVSRVLWNLLPDREPLGDLLVLHHCDVRRCLEPAHLFVGSHAENMTDMAKKGRGTQKLTTQQVEDVRRRYAAGEFPHDIAVSLGVTQSLVSKLVRGRTRTLVSKKNVIQERRRNGYSRRQKGEQLC
jgi:hypothetical protein